MVILYTIKTITIDSRETSNLDESKKKFKNIKSWKRSEVLRDFKFYIISLNMLAMPWIATGVFIYQSFIADTKLWDIYINHKSFMVYSVT